MRRTTTGRLSIQYASRLACAYLLSATAATAIAIPLGGDALGGAHAYFTLTNVIAAVVLVALGSFAVAVGGVLIITPVLRWLVAEREPYPNEQQAAAKLISRQSTILVATWVVSGGISILLDLDGGIGVAVPTLLGVVFGGSAAACIGLLLTHRTLRPILAAVMGYEAGVTAPGILTRLISMWLLCGVLPCGVTAALILMRSNGWIIPVTASVDVPVLVMSLAAVLIGLPTMILTSQSISDPISEVVDAMAEVEQGHIDTVVGVSERSEIGRLQSGFNRMVAGLAERDRVRDLFGRHVGPDVARRAIEGGTSLSGDVREAAVLFVDLVGSTQLTASRPPQQVAELLNDFFQIVVNAVDEREGLINKFQGDAALAVFGAPLRTNGASSSALATARELGAQLHHLPIDYGIGVSAGHVFAGNIGAENRYEYTVIGDPVNAAARLADLAKTCDRRILCSAEVLDRADSPERRHWTAFGSTVLRGRSETTNIFTPTDIDPGHETRSGRLQPPT
nr:adenylate/guanylate cyclase domain-containing protein [Aldersonia kunmingensis]